MTGPAARGSIKDLLAGLIFVGFGLAFGTASLGYEVGSALRMGPGYFPLVLAGVLVVLGVVILVQSRRAAPDAMAIAGVPWAGLGLIVAALVLFGLTVRGLGLAPSLFATAFLAASASRRTGLAGAALIAAVLVLVSVAIFIWGLGLPLRALGPWLGG